MTTRRARGGPSALTSRQRGRLRSLAHSLEPAVLVGRAGVTDAVVREVDDALEARELIKVRLPGDREERARAAAAMAERTSSELAGQIGRVAILYRGNPDPARRKVDLPAD
ncbi:MAG TPA: YhbY family RNA-binding protein [Gemmatimonadota bacterium]|nr:YhbY family RNA-binding protein [Gemmatimonadota bacterium]